MINNDPIAFGGLLIEKDNEYGVKTICNTLLNLAEKQARDEVSSHGTFKSLSIGALVLVGASFAFTGPVGLAIALASIGVGGAEAVLYSQKASKSEKKALIEDVNSTALASKSSDKDKKLQLFLNSTEKMTKDMSVAESAKFWAYVNMFTVGLGSAGIASTKLAGHALTGEGYIVNDVTLTLIEKAAKGSSAAARKLDLGTVTRTVAHKADSITGDMQKLLSTRAAHGHAPHTSAAQTLHESVELAEVYVKFGEVGATKYLIGKYGILAAETLEKIIGKLSASEQVNSKYSSEKLTKKLFSANLNDDEAAEVEAILRDVYK
jgi:hypothetical protein